jgi:hypothetical protein
MNRCTTVRARHAARLLVVVSLLFVTTGCQGLRELVAIPFDMAAHVAMETARMPYEAGKLGAQGLVDVISTAMR